MNKKEEYSSIINYLVEGYEHSRLNYKLTKISIERLLRRYSEERPPKYISNKALGDARDKGVKLKIKNHSSIHSPRKKGVEITFEHCSIVSVMVDRILNQGEDVSSVLDDNVVAIITKDEDVLLNKEGYRYTREGDFKKIYESLGIILIDYNIEEKEE